MLKLQFCHNVLYLNDAGAMIVNGKGKGYKFRKKTLSLLLAGVLTFSCSPSVNVRAVENSDVKPWGIRNTDLWCYKCSVLVLIDNGEKIH